VTRNCECRPTPITARHAINRSTEPESAAQSISREDEQSEEEEALAANRSASSLLPAQSGEHHGVGVDDPLQRTRGGVQVPTSVAGPR